MRHIIIAFTLLTGVITTLRADHSNSVLNLIMHKDLPHSVVLDGTSFNTETNSWRLEDILPGEHQLTVIQHLPNHYNPEITGQSIVYKGSVNIAPASDIYATIEPSGSLNIFLVVPLYPTVPVVADPIHPCAVTCHGHHITPLEFNQLLNSIAQQHGSEEKAEVAKDGMKGHILSTAQVREILSLIPSEKRRVKVAKKVWKRTCDKHNFHHLFNMFHKEQSIEKLLERMYDDQVTR